jgi:hypothetical protein
MYIIPTPLPHGECGVWGRAPIIKQGVFATIFTRITTAANMAILSYILSKKKPDQLSDQAVASCTNRGTRMAGGFLSDIKKPHIFM